MVAGTLSKTSIDAVLARFAPTIGRRLALQKVQWRHSRVRQGETISQDDQLWLALVALLRKDHEHARSLLAGVMRTDKQRVDVPIAIYEWLCKHFDHQTADAFIHLFTEEREKSIYEDIANYVQYLRASPYVDTPLDVQIETLTLCNAKCTFCQYVELNRIGDRMSDAIFEKILCDLEKLRRDVPLTITLYGVNEPFLDKRIWSMMPQIKARLPQAVLALNTNGAPLTAKAIEKLGEIGLARMSVSVNDYRKAEYEATMKIPFERTLEVLRMLNEAKGANVLKFPVGMTRAGDGSIHDLKFIKWARENFPNLSNYYSTSFDWIQDGQARPRLAAPTGCTHWFDMTIRANGKVSFCCIDGHINWPRGDIASESVIDIYNKPEFRRIRSTAVTRLDIDQCRNCRSG
jgi:MoaA/NifB/PqqE/SkfB family radical SAM enzyme